MKIRPVPLSSLPVGSVFYSMVGDYMYIKSHTKELNETCYARCFDYDGARLPYFMPSNTIVFYFGAVYVDFSELKPYDVFLFCDEFYYVDPTGDKVRLRDLRVSDFFMGSYIKFINNASV